MSDPKSHTALTAPEIALIVGTDGSPTLVTATLASAKMVSHTMTGVIQPQIDAHNTAIAAMQGHIGAQREAFAGAKTRLDAHGVAIAGTTAKLDDLTVKSARHDEAITSALLGEAGHIRRLDGVVADLVVRVALLEAKGGDEDGSRTDPAAADEAGAMREANEALRERIEAMEDAIRQLLSQGPQGGGSRSRQR
jgi:hypothetical protein